MIGMAVAITMIMALPTPIAYAEYDEEKSDKKYTNQGNCGAHDGSEKDQEKLEKTLGKLFDKEEKRGLDGSLNCQD